MSRKSIRMPLDNTDLREALETRRGKRSSRVLTCIATLLFTVVVVVGCGSDSARDAERGRREDATRESVVTDLQATQTWNLLYGTPEATPPPEQD
jgi:hypothetical protein